MTAKRRLYMNALLFGPSSLENLADEEAHKVVHFINDSDIVVEVGANIGGSTMLLARRSKLVYAFEPNEIAFKCLRSFLFVARVNNVRLFQAGISEATSQKKLLLESNSAMVSRSSSFYQMNGVEYTNASNVMTYALDSVHFDPKPTSLYVDCEGSEVEVLSGAKKTLSDIKIVIVECHFVGNAGTHESVRKILTEKGFALKSFDYPKSEVGFAQGTAVYTK